MTDFTPAGYLELLDFIQSLQRPIVSFENIPDEGAYVILRHDVDFSLDAAVAMAELDREANATATFFILLTSPYYNPLSIEGVGLVREIASMGHQCGLHYDCTGFDSMSSQQRMTRIEHLAKTLEDSAGVPIKAIAQHKPASSPIRQDFPDFLDAYSASYFKDIKYISDSRRMFRSPDLKDFFRRHERSQMLIHPIWWKEAARSRSDCFVALQSEMSERLGRHLREEEDAIDRFIAALSGPVS